MHRDARQTCSLPTKGVVVESQRFIGISVACAVNWRFLRPDAGKANVESYSNLSFPRMVTAGSAMRRAVTEQ